MKFGDENEQKKALEEFQNASGLGGKPIRISIAVNKSNKTNSFNNQTNTYNSNYQQSYYPQSYQQYYQQWGYDQYGGYNYGYNPYAVPPPAPHGMMGPPPPMPPLPPDMQSTAEQTQDATEEPEEDHEDPNPPLDVEALNKQFMERSEELYDSLMDCYWQSSDMVMTQEDSILVCS